MLSLIGELPQTPRVPYVGSSGDFLPSSPPAEKAIASQDQAGQTSTSDGVGDSGWSDVQSERA
jgi:hypothetical protein